MTTFKGMVDTCQMEMTNGTAACTCWSNSSFTALATTIRFVFNTRSCRQCDLIRGCKIKTSQTAMLAQLASCKSNFSACKQVTFTFSTFTLSESLKLTV